MSDNPRILQQLNSEIDSWRRLLEFMRTENVHLKTRIAEIASDNISNELLEEAESYQHKFIQVDQMISLTLRDIAAFHSQVSIEYPKDGNLRDIFRTQQKLRGDINMLEQKFNKLKFHFNYYLTEKL